MLRVRQDQSGLYLTDNSGSIRPLVCDAEKENFGGAKNPKRDALELDARMPVAWNGQTKFRPGERVTKYQPRGTQRVVVRSEDRPSVREIWFLHPEPVAATGFVFIRQGTT